MSRSVPRRRRAVRVDFEPNDRRRTNESARLASCRASRQRPLGRTESGRSAVAAGSGLHAPRPARPRVTRVARHILRRVVELPAVVAIDLSFGPSSLDEDDVMGFELDVGLLHCLDRRAAHDRHAVIAGWGGNGTFAATSPAGGVAPNSDTRGKDEGTTRLLNATLPGSVSLTRNSPPAYTTPASTSRRSANTAFIQSMTARTQGARRRSR